METAAEMGQSGTWQRRASACFLRQSCRLAHNKAPQEWRVELAALIAATPELDWLLLTKRPENYKKLAPWKEPLLDRVFLEDRLDPLERLVDRLFRGHPVVHYVEHGDAEDML